MKAAPNFGAGSVPARDTLALIERIENADPNSADIGEDDSDASWGHYQFTSGSLSLAKTVTSWASVGNVPTACRLIAGAIKTCRAARHICHYKKVPSESYLSDAYLDRTLTVLLDHWMAAGGVRH